MRNTSILSFVGATLLFAFIAAPSSAFALEKQFIRYDFISDLTQEERVGFVDEKFDDYSGQDLDGVIFQAENSGFTVLEGDGSTISSELNELKNDSRLKNVRSVDSKTLEEPTMSELRSHTEVDPRGFADVPLADEPKRVYIRLKFAEGVDTKATLDEYFDDIAADGLGGAMVEGPGKGLMPTVLEGPTAEVDDWIEKMRYDERFSSVTVVDSVDPATAVYPNLWSHSSTDVRQTTE